MKDTVSKIAAEFGRLGGNTTKQNHGREHYSKAGKKGMAVRWAKYREEKARQREQARLERKLAKQVPPSISNPPEAVVIPQEEIPVTALHDVQKVISTEFEVRKFPPAGTIIRKGEKTWVADGKGGIIVKSS